MRFVILTFIIEIIKSYGLIRAIQFYIHIFHPFDGIYHHTSLIYVKGVSLGRRLLWCCKFHLLLQSRTRRACRMIRNACPIYPWMHGISYVVLVNTFSRMINFHCLAEWHTFKGKVWSIFSNFFVLLR